SLRGTAMRRAFLFRCLALLPLLSAVPAAAADAKKPLQPMDVFRLQFASDPQLAPDGQRVVYVRNFFDVMKDRQRSNLWVVRVDGTGHEALTNGNHGDAAPRWSPDGQRIAYVSDADGAPQLYVRWLDSGRTARLT